jgi:hypothetical protein
MLYILTEDLRCFPQFLHTYTGQYLRVGRYIFAQIKIVIAEPDVSVPLIPQPEVGRDTILSQFHSPPILAICLFKFHLNIKPAISFSVFQVNFFLDVSPVKFCMHFLSPPT